MGRFRALHALIPARKGSKGVPGKNWRNLDGQPLTLWTIAAAQDAGIFDNIVLSTDDDTFVPLAEAAGVEVPFLRPPHLSSDTAGSVDVALHAIETLDWRDEDLLVLLQPTSPFRSPDDIVGCVSKLDTVDCDACISVKAPDAPLHWHKRINAQGYLEPAVREETKTTRRQDALPTLVPNGAVYAIKIATLRATRSFTPAKTCAFEMPTARSIDIDEPLDFQIAEALAPGMRW